MKVVRMEKEAGDELIQVLNAGQNSMVGQQPKIPEVDSRVSAWFWVNFEKDPMKHLAG